MIASPVPKLLLVSSIYPPGIGGPSLQTKQIAQGLMAQGLTVQVVTYGEFPHEAVLDGVPITFLDASPQSRWIGKLWRNLKVFRNLSLIVAQFQPDIIHMQTAAGNLALMVGIAARWYRIPSLIKYTADLTAQNAKIQDFSAQASWRDRCLRQVRQTRNNHFQRVLFNLYTVIWATTTIFQQRLKQRYRVSLKKTFLLPNFIDLEPFMAIDQRRPARSASPPRELELLTVARLFPVKGLDVYLQALAQLKDLPLKARIVGSGSADYQHYLQDLAKQLSLGDRVEFTGAIEPEQVAAAYETADVFVLPSRHEPFGIVLIEAMAAGLPIIASDVDGIPLVVEDGVSAHLVPPGDATRLATAIRALVQSADERQALATAGRQRAQTFALDSGLQRLLEIYQRLRSVSATAAFGPTAPYQL